MHSLLKTLDTHQARVYTGLVALLFAAWMLLPGMGDYSMWYDEVQVVRGAIGLHQLSDLYATQGFPARVVYPPLYFVLLKLWLQFSGPTDMAMRVLPGLLGMLATALVWRAAADWAHSWMGGLAAALIFSGMGFVRYYVQEVHNYSLVLPMAAAAFVFYTRWLHRPTLWHSVGVGAALAGLAYTHYSTVFLIVAFSIHAVWVARPLLARWMLIQIGVVVVYIPWLPVLYGIMAQTYQQTEASTVTAISTPTSATAIFDLLQVMVYDNWPAYLIVAVIGLGLMGRQAAGAGLDGWKALVKIIGPALVTMIACLVLTLLINLVWRTLGPRRMIYWLVFIALSLGYLFARWPRWAAGVGLVAFLVLTPNQPLPLTLPGNWFFRQTVEYVAQHQQPNDAVYFNLSGDLEEAPFRYYGEQLWDATLPFYFADAPLADRLNAYLPRERIWVIEASTHTDALNWGAAALERKAFRLLEQDTVGPWRVSLYALSQVVEPLAHSTQLALPQRFGDQFELTAVSVDQLEVAPGDWVTIQLEWRALQPATENWAVFLHLVEEDGTTFHGQNDGTPTYLGEPLATTYWPLRLPIYDQRRIQVWPDTPPGLYDLRVGLYFGERRLVVTPGDGGEARDGVVVAEIRVR